MLSVIIPVLNNHKKGRSHPEVYYEVRTQPQRAYGIFRTLVNKFRTLFVDLALFRLAVYLSREQ